MKRPSDFYWIVPIFIAFAVLFIMSLEFVYVDGDDASSIAYHVLGRDPGFQSVYAPYQMMMDRLLSVFPSDEPLLRHTSLIMTALSGLSVVVFMIYLAFDWLQDESLPPRWIITIAILLALPEIFYFSLIYSPTLIGFSLILLSHILMRSFVRQNNSSNLSASKYLFLSTASVILFGIGVSFRWNLIIYLGVVLFDLLNIVTRGWHARSKVYLPFVWSMAAVASAGVMILLSGYKFSNIAEQILFALDVGNRAGTLVSDSGVSRLEELLRTALTLSPMLTPVFSFAAITGFIHLVYVRNYLWLTALVGVLGGLPWIKTGNPKFLIVMFPSLMACFIMGLLILWREKRTTLLTNIYRSSFILLLILPWIFGIQITRPNSAWGPSFELRPYDYDENSFSVGTVRVAIDAGAAFPTFEGPRPLYGHAYVLFGGGWREFVKQRAEERANAVDTAITNQAYLVVTNWSPDYYLNDLYRMGFTTKDPQGMVFGSGYFAKREFINAQGQSVVMLVHEMEKTEVSTLINELDLLAANGQYIVLTGYPSMMRELYFKKPYAMKSIGPTIAFLDMSKFVLGQKMGFDKIGYSRLGQLLSETHD